VTSTDPDVVGPLDDFPADAGLSNYGDHEFRAFHSGTADLFVPTPGCDQSRDLANCHPPWVVHVVVN
jgi:hypothetical protein